MNPALMQSQFDTLEEPHDAITVDATEPAKKVVAAIRAALAR
jgi:gluconate kinase